MSSDEAFEPHEVRGSAPSSGESNPSLTRDLGDVEIHVTDPSDALEPVQISSPEPADSVPSEEKSSEEDGPRVRRDPEPVIVRRPPLSKGVMIAAGGILIVAGMVAVPRLIDGGDSTGSSSSRMMTEGLYDDEMLGTDSMESGEVASEMVESATLEADVSTRVSAGAGADRGGSSVIAPDRASAPAMDVASGGPSVTPTPPRPVPGGTNPLAPIGPFDTMPVHRPPAPREEARPAVSIPSADLIARTHPDADTAPALRIEAGDRDAAARLLTKSVRAAEAGEYALSLRAGDDAWKLDPTNPRVANHMATVHLRLGEWVVAEDWCRRAVALDGDYAPAWTNFGLAVMRQGRAGEAERIHLRGVERNPTDWRALAALAAARRDLGRFEEAIETYRRAELVAPHEPALRYNMGITLERSGRPDLAQVEFERFLALSRGSDPIRETQVRAWLDRQANP